LSPCRSENDEIQLSPRSCVYIVYECVCVCVCYIHTERERDRRRTRSSCRSCTHTHTHTHTHAHTHTHTHTCTCIYECVSMCVCATTHTYRARLVRKPLRNRLAPLCPRMATTPHKDTPAVSRIILQRQYRYDRRGIFMGGRRTLWGVVALTCGKFYHNRHTCTAVDPPVTACRIPVHTYAHISRLYTYTPIPAHVYAFLYIYARIPVHVYACISRLYMHTRI
jgi:hypothetical protein